ncbi:apoptosis-inducing taf9-like domain 1 family [Colletotrichum karsti]|uniref:Apoptosis-inducing taf9-like domain 1 family n=1 Tax=Colletotrichum karsti TaxID=1095194 RepID=A0A9P6IJ43_9PEZI|nr:apoptosis-inducing taf9-like domain 1 family [Colletotrichum karsti]KAF9880975.1 apoptosis-inducing taf9-like domain 1 family [Colletotrichum karsti]
MPESLSEEQRERLKAALWFSIGKIVDEESLKQNCNATPQFIGALTEMVWSQIESVAIDLENFSRHASRSQVRTEDVMLLARKNPDLLDLVKEFVQKKEAEKAKKGKGKERR